MGSTVYDAARAPVKLRNQLLIRILMGIAFWALLTLAMAGYLFLSTSFSSEQAFRFSPEQAIRISVRDWVPWALLSPLVIWLTVRFPLERKRLLKSVPVHVVACVLAVAACGTIADWIFSPPNFRSDWAARRSTQPGGGAVAPNRPEGPPREHRPHRPPPSSWLWLRTRLNVPVYWVIVSVVHALTYYRRSQERELKALELSASLAHARLQALKMQLQPHFLFNALNAVATLVHKDPDAADDMIGNLSNLLRLALDNSELQEVPLRKELEFLDCYLEIEQMRLGDRLRVKKQIAAETLDAHVPVMILQPLVENAVRHGIEPSRAPGVVAIRAERDGETLRLAVSDSGAGTGAANASASRPGIGLTNSRARLQELYGTNAQLVMQQAAEGGLAVELRIPFHAQPMGSVTKPEASA